MKPIDVSVTRLAARRYSLAIDTDDLGMTPRQTHARWDSGWLTPVHQSVYLVGSAGQSPEQALLPACLATGSEAVASHTSAAAGDRVASTRRAPRSPSGRTGTGPFGASRFDLTRRARYVVGAVEGQLVLACPA